MGSINNIYSPEEWKIILIGKSKIVPDDYIYKMLIGYSEDGVSYGEITEFISKDNYENILNGNYILKVFPYREEKIIIFDKDNNIVPLVKGKKLIEYAPFQKKLVKSYGKKR